ncbi:MAG: hypothetical protein ACC655_06710, partial [Rhodothermia bacterium]
MVVASEAPPRRFSIAHLALIVPLVALVIAAWGPITDNSFLWHIRAGSLQARSGSVLTTDPFSFTRFGEDWLTQSWLVELLYAWGESFSGLGFVAPMILIVTTITFACIALISYRVSGNVTATAFVLILTTLLMISFLVPRPVLFSFLLFSVLVLAWDKPNLRWTVPFIVWVWAATHGSFVIGLVYLGLTWLMNKEWKYTPTLLLTALVTLFTAHGLGVLEFLASFAESREALNYISEWRKPELFSVVFLPFLGGVVFIVIGAFRGFIFPKHLWLIVPFVLLGMSSVRAIPPAWLGLVPLVALSLSGLTLGSGRRFGQVSAVVFAVTVVLISVLVKPQGGLAEDRFPAAALSSLDKVPTYHDDRAGGFLIWAEGPERPVYIDDRAELYRDRMGEFVRVRDGDEDWRPIFERDGIEQVLLKADESLLDELMDAGWVKVYEDEFYVVLR